MTSVAPQNVIAVVWDFDKTLIPGYMQAPLFSHYGIDGADFWREVDGMVDFYTRAGADLIGREMLYLDHILTYVREGKMPGLSNAVLRQLGAEITLYPGMPQFLNQLRKSIEADPVFADHGIRVEHYVVSTGLRQMILGSAIADEVDGVWGNEFADATPPPGYLDGDMEDLLAESSREITHIIYSIDNTTKTRALFEINKGSNKHPGVDVNAKVPPSHRRVPFENMIYIADGPSDVPSFAVVTDRGGLAYGVYAPQSKSEFEQANRLLEQGRIHSFGEANYEEGSQSYMWILHAAERTAERIVEDRERAISSSLGEAPSHLDD
jgi:hypothetical protein